MPYARTPLSLEGALEKTPLGAVLPCAAPPSEDEARFVQDGVRVVACCPDHAKKALALREGE